MHSDCTKGKGALKIFKEEFVKFDEFHRSRLRNVYIVEPNTVLKIRLFIKGKLCIEKEAKSLRIQSFKKY